MEEVFAESGAIVVASSEYPLDDRVDIEDYEDEKSTNVFEPFVGQCFLSEEEAFIFYKNYANRHGFSIRKGRFVTKNGEIVRRDFFCHREGRQPLKIVNHSLEQRNRESSRCRCRAHLRITLRNSFDIFPKEWHVTTFVVDHNHELLSPLQVRFLPANRVINKDDEKRILLLKEAGLSIRQIMRVMELEKIKHFWAPCYLRGYFFGGMTTTGRSESINAFIKRFVTAHISLVEFAKQIDLSIEDVEQTQSHDTMLETYRGSCLRTLSPLEEQAHSILTPYAFKLFQEEFGRATQYSVLKEKGCEFVLQYYKDKSSQMHKVSWDGEMATCTCKHFEFWGILCRHVRVFLHKDCYHIPPVFLSPRWCREAIFSEKEMPLLDHPNLTDMENEIEENHNDENDSDCFVNCPPISKTKGRPKQKRMKGGRELGKQTRTCGLCKRVGHYITTCP
ncbi:hypothetical protein Vadar_009474 [Vaccinium darrowii]|uniref:Uncharacterized protein n=1 Tax=Vaccinium darrowii TaxID=229202 RepID=A0ACB7Z2U3_9ERIC|nr:hypothetical protein Vadar_009474 [Vaccinium darrowii]